MVKKSLYFAVPLGDPTCFAPVIDYVRGMAERMQNGQNYMVLLIITDGGITGKQVVSYITKQKAHVPKAAWARNVVYWYTKRLFLQTNIWFIAWKPCIFMLTNCWFYNLEADLETELYFVKQSLTDLSFALQTWLPPRGFWYTRPTLSCQSRW